MAQCCSVLEILLIELSTTVNSAMMISNGHECQNAEVIRLAAYISLASNCRLFIADSHNEVWCLLRTLRITCTNLLTTTSNRRERNTLNYYNNTYNYILV